MKNRLLLLVSILLISSFCLRAEKIDIADARRAAVNVYAIKAPGNISEMKASLDISVSFTVKESSLDVYHVFNFKSGGWVVISADDRVTPILAYAFTGAMKPGEGSPELKWWMEDYSKQIKYAVENDLDASIEIQSLWNQWLSGTILPETKGSKSLQPLLISTWDQGNYYNYLCPEDPAGSGGHVWSGCVATCMAQVMYYYRYPQQGTGTHGYYSDYGYLSADFGATTYDWNAMQNDINHYYNIPMALIQYHCGIAVDMMYDPDGSGAYMTDATQAVIDYFGYSPSTNLKSKDDYTESQWRSMVKSELDLKRPLCYSGHGSGGGHAFVCDGYEGVDHFHFNWGWSGYGDGYFYLSNLNPSGTFTNGQQAIFNMIPASGFPYACSGTTTITDVRGTVEDGSGPISNYSSNSDCTWLISPDEPVDHIKLSFDRFETESGNDIVTVYDGATTSDSVLGVFSGSSIPAMIESTGDKMLIRFTTNGSVISKGWFATFNSVYPVYCNYMNELTAPSGVFSDGSDTNDYINGTVCRWRIAPPGATAITLNFNSLNLEGFDCVRVFDEPGNLLIGTYSGNTNPGSIFVFTSKVLVLFMTDNFNTADGFEISYTSSNTGINNTEQTSSIALYPNPASENLFLLTSSENIEPFTVKIFSSTGKEVYNSVFLSSNNQIPAQIDVSSLTRGLYLVTIQSSAYQHTTKVILE